MKKVFTAFMALFILVTAFQFTAVQASGAGSSWLITSELDKGVLGVQFPGAKGKTTKVMITKGGNSYTYNLNTASQTEKFPLQQGNGSYKVSILENTTGNKYKVLHSENVELSLTNNSAVYLGSVQNVKWSESDAAIKKAKELTQGLTTDEAKVQAIYKYVVSNIKYDTKLASSVTTDYLPNINNTLASGKGICYDYASLFAAMLRSVDVPSKLVMGDSSYVTQYHAWNEVLLNGKWVVIDTTVDAGMGKAVKADNMIKSAAKYKASKYY